MRFRFSLRLLILLTVTLLVATVYHAAATALDAEKTLHMYLFVLDTATSYVAEYPGEWPKSWDELLTSSTRDRAYAKADLAQRIQFDFSTTSSEIVAAGSSNFDAIVQVAPDFGPDEGRIEILLREIKRGKLQESHTR